LDLCQKLKQIEYLLISSYTAPNHAATARTTYDTIPPIAAIAVKKTLITDSQNAWEKLGSVHHFLEKQGILPTDFSFFSSTLIEGLV